MEDLVKKLSEFIGFPIELHVEESKEKTVTDLWRDEEDKKRKKVRVVISPKKNEDVDEEIEKEGFKKKVEKVKEVFHEWKHLNMNTLLFNKVVDVPVVLVPKFIDGVDVPVIMQRRGVSHTVKVPQTHFIAGVSGHSCCST